MLDGLDALGIKNLLKASDTVDHKILLRKMEIYGIGRNYSKDGSKIIY